MLPKSVGNAHDSTVSIIKAIGAHCKGNLGLSLAAAHLTACGSGAKMTDRRCTTESGCPLPPRGGGGYADYVTYWVTVKRGDGINKTLDFRTSAIQRFNQEGETL